MKLEIEVTEGEIKTAIERHIRSAIAERVNAWGSQEYVKKAVQQAWNETVDSFVKECMRDNQRLKDDVMGAIQRKLQAQVTKLMKETK